MKKYIYSLGFVGLLLFGACADNTKKSSEKENRITDEYTGNNYAIISEDDTPESIIEKAANITPAPRQLKWQELEMTAFIHFGVNTFTGREWGTGEEDPDIFDPTDLDAEQWVKTVKDAGFKLIILTAKHHDGFCLWPSEYTEHSVKNSPWKDGKGDVVKEVAEAAKKHDIGFGVYLSPWDMNYPDYGDTEKYNEYFVNQLTELLSNYGQVDEVWFDGANGTGSNGKVPDYHFDDWYALIRELQPQATIAIMGPDVRWVGTETGYGRETEWSVVPTDSNMQERIAEESQQDVNFKPEGDMTDENLGGRDKIVEAKGLVWYPAEADVSIRPGWFYHEEQDDEVKSVEKLSDIYYSSVGRNNVLLVNFPPDKRGLIHENDIEILKDWRAELDQTFDENLADNAQFSSDQDSGLKALSDGDNDTYWTTDEGATAAEIEIELDGEKTFDVLMLQEEIRIGQRIEKFELHYLDGDDWKKAAEGTTVGYKRLLRFDPVTSDKVKLVIKESRLNPTLKNFGLYKRP